MTSPQPDASAVQPAGTGQTATARCLDGLRQLITSGQIMPGEQIRQDEVSAHFAVSRVPLREALRTLEAEGSVIYERNRGYFVTKLQKRELEQLYRMRELLERELLESVTWPDADALHAIARHNESMIDAAQRGDVIGIVQGNRAFHFAIFGLSPLDIIYREVVTLWSRSEPYRAVYLYNPTSRARVLDEHRHILRALEARDRDALIQTSDQHRASMRDHLAHTLIDHVPMASATRIDGE
jgi:DNA-binding GntR family transcriptional regulator